MRLNKEVSLIAIIALIFFICACAKGGSDLKIETSPSNESLVDLASQIYDEQQLSELANFNGSMNELSTKCPIECLRKNDGIYRASYLGEESIAVLIFDDSGSKVLGKVYNIQLLKSEFDALKKGQSLDDVRSIDPNGEYLFLYTGRNDIPKTSSHYTKDGYLITIEYDTSNFITSINIELI